MHFSQFYKITFGMPEIGLPSFSYVPVDEYARISERVYGTITPADPLSVIGYDTGTLTKLFTRYIGGMRAHNPVDVRIVMKSDALFSLKGVESYLSGSTASILIRAGLLVDCTGRPQTVYDRFPFESLTPDDSALINWLSSSKMACREGADPQACAEAFAKQFPGYIRPEPVAKIEEEDDHTVSEFHTRVTSEIKAQIERTGKLPYAEFFLLNDDETHIKFQNAFVTVGKNNMTILHKSEQRQSRTVRTAIIAIDQLFNRMAYTEHEPIDWQDWKSIQMAFAHATSDVFHKDGNPDSVGGIRLRGGLTIAQDGKTITATFDWMNGAHRAEWGIVLQYKRDVVDFNAALHDILNKRDFVWIPK